MSNIDTELYSSCRKGNNDNNKSGCTKSQDDKLRFLPTRKRSTSRYVLWSNFKPHLFRFRFYVIIHLNIFILTFLCFHITTFLFIFCKQHYGRQNFTFVSLCWQFFCLTSLKVSPGSSDVVKLCASLLCGASLQWDGETIKGLKENKQADDQTDQQSTRSFNTRQSQ